MDQKSDTKPTDIKLNCCQGRPVPVPVVEGWRQFLQLPEQARKGFWDVLFRALLEPANPANKQRIEAFSREHGLEEENVVSAMRGCDLLLRQACALDMDTASFRQDLVALSEEDEQSAEFILSQYDEAKTDLRKFIIQESLADHGKVLVGIDWRVDKVTASDRGAKLNTTVVLLTLRYRDGTRLERITLQLTPDAIRELKSFSDRFSR
ncbi:MAG: hypothetical protein JSV55_10800 [Deltaproteobacteria bacterium]|nr:MAG: hypothetical protein JSV40_00490 [Deltaproteobacteria bacterium]UCH06588.1 MAG: hypothetical protein JSV55_10800 [Deltaproteobacteria bacterium]